MDKPWDRARKTKSQLQEDRLGRMEGGKKQVNSGRTWLSKRDAVLRNFLIEARTTDKGSYRIEEAEWLDIRKQSFQTPPGLLPAMQIDFTRTHLMVIELAAHEEREVRLMELEARVERYEREFGKLPEVQ